MLAKTLSCGLSGVYGYPVEVEAFISNGMIGFEIVGLPSTAVCPPSTSWGFRTPPSRKAATASARLSP